jgi:hypothetical protein
MNPDLILQAIDGVPVAGLPGAVVSVVSVAVSDVADYLPGAVTVATGLPVTDSDTVPVRVTFQRGDVQHVRVLSVPRSHALYRRCMPSPVSSTFDRLSDSDALRARDSVRRDIDRLERERLERVAALQALPDSVQVPGGRVKVRAGSRADTVARAVAGTDALLVETWNACERVARIVCKRMRHLTDSDVSDVAADTFLHLYGRHANARDTFDLSACVEHGRAGVPIWQAVRRMAGVANAARERIDVSADWQAAAESGDVTGRNKAQETARQVQHRDVLRNVAALANADANVRAYLRDRLQVPPVPCESMDAAESGEHSTRARHAVILRHRNATAEPIGRARVKVKRGKATRRQSAAVAIADTVGHGYTLPTWPTRFDAIAANRRVRIDALPVERETWRMLSTGAPSASAVTVHSRGCRCGCRESLQVTGDVSAVLQVLRG